MKRKTSKGVVLTLIGLLALSACAPGSNEKETSPETSNGESNPRAEVVTDISSLGEQTLVVWDQEFRGGQNEQIEQLNQAFMDKYPNITIERNAQSYDDLMATVRLALSGNDAPDVVQVNNARSGMGQFVKAGLLSPLDDYAVAYGWRDRFSGSILSYSSYSDDGKVFGDGTIYGLPQVGEIVGLFYNPMKLEELNLELPTDWQEFEAQLSTIKEAGEIPLVLGNVDKWPAIHVFGPIQGAHVQADEIRKLGFGNEGGSWDTPENLEAANELSEWAEAGYFTDGFNGIDYDSAWQDFASGNGVYLMAGSWLGADLDAAMEDGVGFIAPPVAKVNGVPATTGGTGLPFAISSKSENPDVGAAYIDFITSDEAMKVIADTGGVPVNNADQYAKDATGVSADIMNVFTEVSSNGEVLPYLDYATPSMGDTLTESLQSLLSNKFSAEEFLDSLERDYKEFTG